MFGRHIYTAAMSIRADRETLFNEVYDSEHIPALKAVPGVIDVRRFRRIDPAATFYLAVYQIADPDVPNSPAWLQARDLGRWPTEVRPFTSGLKNGLYAWHAGFGDESPADAGSTVLVVTGGESMARLEPGLERVLDSLASYPDVVAGAHYVDLRDGSFLAVARLSWRRARRTARAMNTPIDLAGLGPIEAYAPV